MRKIGIGRRRRISLLDIAIWTFLLTFAISIVYPFYNAILTSIVTSKEYLRNPAMLYPREITWDNYRVILQHPYIVSGYTNTLTVVSIGLALSMLMTVSMAYALSNKFPGRRVIFLIVIFTMFFNGGLIPIYLLFKNLGLTGKLAALLFVQALNPFYLIIMKTGFEQVPESLSEAAKMEGANDILIYTRIMLPLQTALIATFALFITVDRWNEWFFAMLFVKRADQFTLQVLLRAIIYQSADNTNRFVTIGENVSSTGVKIAAVIVTMLPIMLFYPFLQKYFAKGVLVGAIKA